MTLKMALLSLNFLLAVVGCMPCLATPDCPGHHTVRVVDVETMSITRVHYRFMKYQGTAEEWTCPGDDSRCRDNGQVAIMGDGRLVMILEDGRSREVMLRTGDHPECGCAELTDETVEIL